MGSKKELPKPPTKEEQARIDKDREEHLASVAAESTLAIQNAIKYEVKERDGDAFVHASIVISLIELPRSKDGGPGEQRAFIRIKTTNPIEPETAVEMLKEAASQYLWKRDNPQDPQPGEGK